MKEYNSTTDILIIGGGIAGCIAAISLVNHYNVTLLDKLVEPVDRIGESLAPAAQRILKELDLLENESEAIKQTIFRNNLGMQSYWGNSQLQIVDHMRNPDGFSRSLDRKNFEVYLRNVAAKRGVNCIWGTRLSNSSYENNYWKITTKSDDLKNRTTHTIHAKFVIDATGRQSHFTKSLGIQRTSYDKLISCWMSLPNTQENTMSTIVANELGWWYSAVVPDNKRVIAFQTDPDLVDRNTFKHVNTFLSFAKEHKLIQPLIEGNETTVNFHGTVSANSTRLEQVTGKQWGALGDAAMSFDPLSSQGMFNAMANAMQLQKLLIKYDFIKDLDSTKEGKFNILYENQLQQVWNHYLKHKNFFYSTETRWKEAPFWKRRGIS
ncbi:tryptophan 7-halogenase [Tenacibaculum sp. Mcav3-52]|uniref:NAD(P)/FAD-dependent oxidoreductase n=1 Tax=Tenacibaculum sp. Mcav3-52 TaxID=2917762 RepID=UPI001EF2FAA4|nr:tryptophan 7-halogenase [Tenacibaculum sp. Mcav3-52]MCG7502118.1 tryptophan 7-halogenase [Tenacibaculum sp. Mcav3-52]